jgi:hypothetical protein
MLVIGCNWPYVQPEMFAKFTRNLTKSLTIHCVGSGKEARSSLGSATFQGFGELRELKISVGLEAFGHLVLIFWVEKSKYNSMLTMINKLLGCLIQRNFLTDGYLIFCELILMKMTYSESSSSKFYNDLFKLPVKH